MFLLNDWNSLSMQSWKAKSSWKINMRWWELRPWGSVGTRATERHKHPEKIFPIEIKEGRKHMLGLLPLSDLQLWWKLSRRALMKVQRLHTLGENGGSARTAGHQPCTWLQTNASSLPTEQDWVQWTWDTWTSVTQQHTNIPGQTESQMDRSVNSTVE